MTGVECEEGEENWLVLTGGDSWFQGESLGGEGTVRVSGVLGGGSDEIPEGVVLFFFLFFLGDRLSEDG